MERPNPSLCPTGPAKVVAKLPGHSGGVLAMAFSPDRGRLVSAGRDGLARLWDMGNDPPVERAALGPAGRRLVSIAFAPTGRALVAGSGALDGSIWLFDVSGPSPL
jgi:eukaryotic-like serine/threonine-protein kinase